MKVSIKIAKPVKSRRGGRPSRDQAEKIEDEILDVARDMFFSHGYGSTSIEMIAKQAGISKRTFYHRFDDKADIFRAVVHRLIGQLRPGNIEGLFERASAEEILHRIAPVILQASLSPQSLALNRIILAESARFPELAFVVNEQGMRQEAIQRIAAILDKEVQAKRFHIGDTFFAAEQFLVMVVAGPQRRAYGLGKPMTRPELIKWANDAVDLFLKGCRG